MANFRRAPLHWTILGEVLVFIIKVKLSTEWEVILGMLKFKNILGGMPDIFWGQSVDAGAEST